MFLEVFPRHRDGGALDVLTRPRVHDSPEGSRISSGGSKVLTSRILFVVALPGVTYRVSGSGLSELLDFRISQLRIEIQVSLLLRSSNTEDFVGLVRDCLAAKSLAGIRGRNLSWVEVRAQKARIGKAPISERAVLRVIKGNAQAPGFLVGAARARLRGVPAETSLAALRSAFRDNARTGRQVRGLLRVLLNRAFAVGTAQSAGEASCCEGFGNEGAVGNRAEHAHGECERGKRRKAQAG